MDTTIQKICLPDYVEKEVEVVSTENRIVKVWWYNKKEYPTENECRKAILTDIFTKFARLIQAWQTEDGLGDHQEIYTMIRRLYWKDGEQWNNSTQKHELNESIIDLEHIEELANLIKRYKHQFR